MADICTDNSFELVILLIATVFLIVEMIKLILNK